jgi:hypothetical protein
MNHENDSHKIGSGGKLILLANLVSVRATWRRNKRSDRGDQGAEAITKPLNDYVRISSLRFKLYEWNIRTFFP